MKKAFYAASLAVSLLLTPYMASAEVKPVPSQAEWAYQKKTVKLPNGIEMGYSEMGNTEGQPLLLIHGFTDNSRSWSLVAPYLKDYHIFAIDLRGHGVSSAPNCCYTPSDFANDTYLFLEEMKLDKVNVVGHSLGSLTAQMLAATHPDKVKKVVLVSSTVRIGMGPGSWLWDNIMPLQPPIDPEGKFMINWYWNPNPVDPTFIKAERHESAKVPLQVWKGVMWGTLPMDLTDVAKVIKAPVMILWGDQDQLFDQPRQDALKAAYPNAKYEVFKGAGHNMFWERPEHAAELIDEFLK